jgi:hypothetical protein
MRCLMSEREINRVRDVRGQATIEIAILLAVVALLMAVMLGYIRSARMHYMKSGTDGIGYGLLYPP